MRKPSGVPVAGGEGDGHRHRVGDDLQDLGSELGEGTGVQVAVLDQAEEHRLEVGVSARVPGTTPGELLRSHLTLRRHVTFIGSATRTLDPADA